MLDTNTHWDYVMFIAFQQQQLLHERALTLRSYIACLVIIHTISVPTYFSFCWAIIWVTYIVEYICKCTITFDSSTHESPNLQITYLLTPWCRVLLEKLTGLQLVKKFPAFHGTRRFTTALTRVRHLSLSWASPIQSKYPHPTSWRSIPILSTHLRLGLPSDLFPSGFPTQTLQITEVVLMLYVVPLCYSSLVTCARM